MSRREEVVYESTGRNRWDRARFDEYVRDRSRPGSRDREIDIRISDNRRELGGTRDRPVVVAERDQFVERDRYVGGGDIERRREYWDEPIGAEVANRALLPYRRKEYYEAPVRPVRPMYIRRQSSLDTFDRIPRREYDDQWRRPVYVPVPVPVRDGRRRYEDDYEDIRVRDRGYDDGWDEEYRDVRVRRRRGGRRRRSISISSSSSSSSSDLTSLTSARSSRTIVKEDKVTLIGRRGRTRMPKRLVHKQVIIDMGLPFVEEDHFILVKRALLREHIDDIIRRSEGYRDSNKITYKFSEEVGPALGVGEIEDARSVVEEKTVVAADSVSSFGGRGTAVVEERERISARDETVREGGVIEEVESSRSGITGSGVIALRERSHSQSFRRSDRSIREEIRALEAEREALRLERRADRRYLEAGRLRDGYDSVELVEGRRDPFLREEIVTLGRDRRGRAALISKKI